MVHKRDKNVREKKEGGGGGDPIMQRNKSSNLQSLFLVFVAFIFRSLSLAQTTPSPSSQLLQYKHYELEKDVARNL